MVDGPGLPDRRAPAARGCSRVRRGPNPKAVLYSDAAELRSLSVDAHPDEAR